MGTHNGELHYFDERLDALKAGVHKIVETSKSAESRVTEMIKAHPVAAIGVAAGLGYAVVRLVRR